MMNPKNPIQALSNVDTSRSALDEAAILADAYKHWRNRFDVDPNALPSKEGCALLTALTKGASVHDGELISKATDIAVEIGLPAPQAEKAVTDLLAFALEQNPTDALASAAAKRTKQIAAIRQAEQREQDAYQAVFKEPTETTRRRYAEAMLATIEANRMLPIGRRSMDSLLRASIQRMDAGQGKGVTGIPTPIYGKLSDALFGWRGLIVIAAAPGVGKTTLALTAALDAVQSSKDACMLFVSFEMGTNVLCDRMISQMSGVSQRVLRSGPMDEKKIEERDEARKRLFNLGHRVTIVGREDVGKLTGDASSCLSNIAQIVEQMKAQSGATRSFVVIDHLGVVPVELPEKRPWPNDTERVRHVMSGLVGLRDRLGDDNPVVLIAQARKNDWSSAELASVMGTADTAYTADAVIVISRSNDEEDNQETANNRTKQKLLASIVKGRDMMRYAEISMTFDITTSTLVEDDAR